MILRSTMRTRHALVAMMLLGSTLGCGKQEVKSEGNSISGLSRNATMFHADKNIRAYVWAHSKQETLNGVKSTLQCWYYRETAELSEVTDPVALLDQQATSNPLHTHFIDIQELYGDMLKDIAFKRFLVDTVILAGAGGCWFVSELILKNPRGLTTAMCGTSAGAMVTGINVLSGNDVTWGSLVARDRLVEEVHKGPGQNQTVNWNVINQVKDKITKIERTGRSTKFECPSAKDAVEAVKKPLQAAQEKAGDAAANAAAKGATAGK